MYLQHLSNAQSFFYLLALWRLKRVIDMEDAFSEVKQRNVARTRTSKQFWRNTTMDEEYGETKEEIEK